MTTTQPIITEKLDHGLTRQWLEAGRIMVLTMPEGAHREAIDVWFNTLMETAAGWHKQRPFLVLHDNRELGFSYYFRERALAAAKEMPQDMTGKAAVLVPKGVIGTLITMLAKLTSSTITADFRLKTFNNYDQALSWLQEDL